MDSKAEQPPLKDGQKEASQRAFRELFTLVAGGGDDHDLEYTCIQHKGLTKNGPGIALGNAIGLGMGTTVLENQTFEQARVWSSGLKDGIGVHHTHGMIKVSKSGDRDAVWCGGWLPSTNWHKDIIEENGQRLHPNVKGTFEEASQQPLIKLPMTSRGVIAQASANGESVEEFKIWVRSLSAKSLCGSMFESATDAVNEILRHEFAFGDGSDWNKLVYDDRENDQFGLGVDIDKEKTRSPFDNVLKTRMGRGLYEAEALTDEEVLQEIRELVIDWHDLFADAFPWIGKLLIKLKMLMGDGSIPTASLWLDGQTTGKIAYDPRKNDYVDGGIETRVMLRDQVRRLIVTMYIYEKMSLRSLLDSHFLASLHKYYEGALAHAQKDLSRAEKKTRERMLAKGTFGSLFMQLKQASVSVTFPGLSAMKNGEEVEPITSAGLLGILSVNIFEAVMGELLIKGRLGNGACGVALIGTESQKDVNYVNAREETPHLVQDATFHSTILFGQGECPEELKDVKVCPMHIPLDKEYLNAYTSWNALFTTTMSDNHIVFAKLLYPRMLRAMIYDPGQWGDQRPWSLYMAVSGFWLRTEQHKDFFTSVDFFAAANKQVGKLLAQNADHAAHKLGNVTGLHLRTAVNSGVSHIAGYLKKAESDPSPPPEPMALDVSFEELDDLLSSQELDTIEDTEGSDDMGDMSHGQQEEDEINTMKSFTEVEHDTSQSSIESSERDTSVSHKVKAGLHKVAVRPIDIFTRSRATASYYKAMLPEYPAIIQFWTEMNHRYGDLLMEKTARYNFSPRFLHLYKKVSFKCREGECIDRELPHAPIPLASHPAPRAAVPMPTATFIFQEIMKTGGRTHDYLRRFYLRRDEQDPEKFVPTEMAEQMHSSIYPFSSEMDMKALIEKTGQWSIRYDLPRLDESLPKLRSLDSFLNNDA